MLNTFLTPAFNVVHAQFAAIQEILTKKKKFYRTYLPTYLYKFLILLFDEYFVNQNGQGLKFGVLKFFLKNALIKFKKITKKPFEKKCNWIIRIPIT